LLDPEIVVKPVKGQIDDLIGEISERVQKKSESYDYHPYQKDGGGFDGLFEGGLTLKLNICILTLIPLREWK